MQIERGSILVLTLVGVLILSLLATGLLTVGTTEINTTRNFYLNKYAYYTAVQGVEEIRTEIKTIDPDSVGNISRSSSETLVETYGVHRSYITGSLYNMQKNEPKTLEGFKGFPPPSPTGTSIGKVDTTIWRVIITSKATQGNRKGYAEIEVGIVGLLPGTGYE
jgi:hypothetical protein